MGGAWGSAPVQAPSSSFLTFQARDSGKRREGNHPAPSFPSRLLPRPLIHSSFLPPFKPLRCEGGPIRPSPLAFSAPPVSGTASTRGKAKGTSGFFQGKAKGTSGFFQERLRGHPAFSNIGEEAMGGVWGSAPVEALSSSLLGKQSRLWEEGEKATIRPQVLGGGFSASPQTPLPLSSSSTHSSPSDVRVGEAVTDQLSAVSQNYEWPLLLLFGVCRPRLGGWPVSAGRIRWGVANEAQPIRSIGGRVIFPLSSPRFRNSV